MTGYISPDPFKQFFDNAGKPLAYGLLWPFAAGTSTPLDVFTDSTLTVPCSHPIVLDSAGCTQYYPTPNVAYKFILTVAGGDPSSPLRTQNNVTMPAPTIVTPSALPAGCMVDYAGTTVPAGSDWLMADGAEYPKSTFPALYEAIGTAWNTGGETAGYFRVPDKRQRVWIGLKTAGSGTAHTLGEYGGAIDHAHTGTHHHTNTHTHPVPKSGWTDTQQNPNHAGVLLTGGYSANFGEPTGDNTTGASSAANTGDNALVTGSNNQLYGTANCLIKT